MEFAELSIEGAWRIQPRHFGDERGVFLEVFKNPLFTATVGHGLRVEQVNCSVSAAGVVRGIHFADVPPGQAKYVTCVAGAVLDVIVDLRVGSPSFGQWEGVLLDATDRAAVYISEGLGHGFMALEDNATVTYLCSTPYNPDAEHEVNPLDTDLGIDWPTVGTNGDPLTPQFSPKDAAAPSLAQALEAGTLPTLEATAAWRRSL